MIKMLKKLLPVILLILIMALSSSPAFAVKEIKNDLTTISEDINVREDEVVYGNLTAVSGNIIVMGKVYGNLTSATGDINLRETARVMGNITTGSGQVIRVSGAEVTGNIFNGFTQNRIIENEDKVEQNREDQVNYRSNSFDFFTKMLGMLAVIAIVLSVFPKNLEKMLNAFNLEAGRVVLVGVLGWVLLPFAMIISIVTIIGPFIIGLGAFVGFLAGIAIVGLLLGEKIKQMLKWQNDNKIMTAFAGIAVLWLASLLPVAPVFIVIICGVIGMGVVLVTKFGSGRPWFPPKNAGSHSPAGINEQWSTDLPQVSDSEGGIGNDSIDNEKNA
jgi:cytoskeletal protein CcmA (bactofilin family)